MAIVAVVLLAAGHCLAQTPRLGWAKQLTQSGDGGFPTLAAAQDAQGNLIFVGSDGTALPFGDQNLTNSTWIAKCSGSGDLLWVRQLTASWSSVATDGEGNVIVAGSGDAGLVTKFDSQGNQLWVLPTEGGLGQTQVAVDGGGNIHVASMISATNLFLAEYSPAGDELWTNVFSNPPVIPPSLAVDSAGNSYLAGAEGSLTLAKYDPNGTLLWTKGLGDSTGISALAAGPQGDFTILGEIGGTNGLAKFDTSGNLLWFTPIDAIGYSDFECQLILDPMGNSWAIGFIDPYYIPQTDDPPGVVTRGGVTVGGVTVATSNPNLNDECVFLAKFDAAGDLLWARLLDSTNATLYAVGALDSTGSLLLLGEAWGTNTINLDGTVLGGPATASDFYFAARIPGPSVSVQPLGSEVVISWPTNAAGLSLESCTDLSAGNWSPVTNPPATVGDQFTITNAVSEGSRFYRLRN